MTEDAPKPPAGWYPTPSGGQRYWDGDQWIALPAPNDASRDETVGTRPQGSRSRGRWVAIVVAAAVLLGGGATAVTWKLNADAAAQEAAEEEAAEAAAQAKAERERKAQETADEAERERRRESVTAIEESIVAMANQHVSDGVIDGPIIDATCSPVGGGSTDNLTETTTVFECFIANKDNGDGTMSGYTYNATMNWDTGAYTYGLGAP